MKDKVKKGAGGSQAKADALTLTGGSDAVDIKDNRDTSFTVKIQGAGVEPFELQVHGFWLVQDAVMALLSRDEICPRSNLSLALAGTTLDPVVELKSLKGLKAGSILRLVEEPYNGRSARHHLARAVELLRAPRPQDALREGCSPSILETITHTHSADSGLNGKNMKRSSSNTKTESGNYDGAPPEYLLPGSLERPLMALLPHSSQSEAPSHLRDLSLSCWNPPPGHRKLQGDFLYITVVTMEGRRCDITSCPKGFYLNRDCCHLFIRLSTSLQHLLVLAHDCECDINNMRRSTEEVFDPRPAQSSSVYHCFTDLLAHISPAFKQSFTSLKTRPQLPPVETTATPYPTLSWLGPPCASRTHKNTFSRLGLDEQAQAPDWNEELQAARDMPQRSAEERLQRDRALLQVNSAFVRAVMQGAESVIDGFVEPINGNPEDPAFLWGGLFMSQGVSALFDGERSRRAAQRLELKGVQAYSNLELRLPGLHTLPTAIVDYRGIRLSAQGFAPGFEGSDQDRGSPPSSRGLLYGINAGPQESPQRRHLLELLAHAAKALSIKKNVVVAPSGQKVPLFTSVDAQGLVGADGRFYILDVFRSFPPDVNYSTGVEQKSDEVPEGEEKEKSCKVEERDCKEEESSPQNDRSDLGLPQSFPHSLCRLRPELVQAFIQHKHSQFTQFVKERLEENGDSEASTTASGSPGSAAVRAACKEVGSLSNIIFEMRFNPNMFCPGLCFPSSETESMKLQERLLREAAAFIITHQIPAFLEQCLKTSDTPMDGATLKQALHQTGINLRYLGHVIKAISQSEHRERLRHIMRVVIGEIFIRSTKRVFNSFVQGVDVSSLSAAVSHFLCCLLAPHFTPSVAGEETKKKSRRRGRGAGASESTPWSTLSGAELWNQVHQDAVETYNISDSLGSGLSHLMEHYGLQKLSLLREFCLKTGVQLRLRDYFLDNQSKAPISADDILNIFPVVKYVQMPMVDATKAYQAAQSANQKGLLEKAHEHLKEAVYLFDRVCDDLHPEACHCLSLLAKVTFLQGKAAEARSVQLRTVVVSERVFGFDHPNTVQQYMLLAVYFYAGGESVLAQKCLLRARLLILSIHGEDHPYIATVDSCLGLVLTGDQAGQFLKNAYRLNTSFFGPTNLHTALNQHLLAQWLCSKCDYRSAMTHEKDALAAFTSMFGEDHPQTRRSAEFLSTITKQAVRVERCLRQAGPDGTEQTVECINPTTDTILEQMVIATGIRAIAHSDRFQEFKQKLLEQKASEAKEESKTARNKPDASETAKRPENCSDQETECEKEVKDGGHPVEENANDNQEKTLVQDLCVENTAIIPANGYVAESVEQSLNEKKTEASGAVSDVELGVNGEAGEESKTDALIKEKSSTANEECSKADTAINEMKLDEVNCEINEALEITAGPSVFKNKETPADVLQVTKAAGDQEAAINGVTDGNVTANGLTDE